jgi:hypothetical protein
MKAQRQISKLADNPEFVRGVNQCRVTFLEFLLRYDVGLTPQAKEFLNRDMSSFFKPRTQK